MVDGEVGFVCPACSGELWLTSDSYRCGPCDLGFPILAGIPDFRLRSDRYLTLDEERSKALRVAEASPDSFLGMLDYYYSITDDVPPELGVRYKAYHVDGPARARHAIEQMALHAGRDITLDAGCGTGGTLIAASGRCQALVGVDIAMRWLVMCRQRLRETGIEATLVCADVESLPFPDGTFHKIFASDLLENVHCVQTTLRSLDRKLRPDGSLWVSGTNRYCIGPHPTTRIWGVGYLPSFLRARAVKLVRGVDSLRFVNLISPMEIVKRAEGLGLRVGGLAPQTVRVESLDQYPRLDRILIKIYELVSQWPLLRRLLVLLGPAFEVKLQKTAGS